MTKGYTVLLQFGDGNFHQIGMEADSPEQAVEDAKDWVLDNAWLEVIDEDGMTVLAEERLR